MLLRPAEPVLNPTSVGALNALASHEAEELLKNYKLTPATLAYKLANRNVLPGGKLRWMPSPHLMYISAKIAVGIARGNARIIISAPPRHGKSKLSTHYGPTWVMENFDNFNVALVTYGADLSTDFAREVRDTIEDNPDLLSVRIRQDASRLANFLTNKGGGMISVGINGPFTGRGANVLFVDDYIKTIKEALSPAFREDQWEWFTSTAMTRLEPDASVVIIATRWHEDDLIGRILTQLGTTNSEKGVKGEWEYIKLHALARENDILGRQPGEALFPQRYPVPALLSRKNLLGSIFFDAIYDQEPHSVAGKFASRNWIKKIAMLPTGKYKFLRVWDMAGTEGGGDYTVGGLFAFNAETTDLYLVNLIRRQLSPFGVEALIKATAAIDGPGISIVIEQESGSSGKTVVEHYRNTVLKEYNVTGYYSNKHKLVKAQPFLACAEAGKFALIEAGWNEEYLKEFDVFPEGDHDDQVDVCSIAFEVLNGRKKGKATWGRKPEKAREAQRKLQRATPEETKAIIETHRNADVEEIVRKQATFSTGRKASWGGGR